MKLLNIFSITENTDKTEGKGRTKDTGIAFLDYESAVQFAQSDHYKKFAVMGIIDPQYARCDVAERAFVVYESFADYEQNSKDFEKQRAKQAALAKLSPAEREALGL